MRHNSRTMFTVRAIRSMIEEGATDAEIAASLGEDELDAEIDARLAEYEHELRYGHDGDDEMTAAEREFHDRLSLGRNDAGEWLGFM